MGLAPFMSQTAITFWQDRMWYFDQGLYYQGGMVSMYWQGWLPCVLHLAMVICLLLPTVRQGVAEDAKART